MNMKKLIRMCAVLLLVAAAAMVVVYRAVNQVPSPELPQYEQVYKIFEDGGCLSCHSADPKLPFYAKMPVAGNIIMKDMMEEDILMDLRGKIFRRFQEF